MSTSVDFPLPGDAGNEPRSWKAISVESLPGAWVSTAGFLLVIGVALALNVWSLSEIGYGNTYYAAAVRSMTESWKNFFFVSLDPGGFISVDKPPVFLWIDALSARILGYSSWSLLLPSAVAGAATVALVWVIVRHHFGVLAATLAGLVLAVTPIAVAVNRLNLPEPFYILALVGAAYAVLRSLESPRWWGWIIAAAVLVGIAFNTKMLAGWIPGPALALAIVAGAEGPWRTSWKQWLPRLAVLGVVTATVSASWLMVVDAWPASSRPYVGGSTDNTVADLVLGYNGLGRVEGDGQGAGGRGNAGAANNRNGGGFTAPQQNVPARGGGTLPGGQGNAPQAGGGNAGAGARGPGGIIAGAPGLLRMFDPANGGQIAWFLPFALIGGVLSLWHWRNNNVLRGAAVLWLGWVLLFGSVFSYTQGIYHSYYTAALAPGIAVLAGMGTVATSALVRRHRGWLIAAAGTAGVTLWVQLMVAGRIPDFFEWVQPFTVVTVLSGLALLAAVMVWQRLPATVGLTVIVAGLLMIPASWSSYEAAHASLNTTLPQAGPRQGAAGRSFGSDTFDNGTTQLANWLETHTNPDGRWDLAVSSAQNASTLIAEHDLSVMALGGFLGTDPTISVSQFGKYVADGDVRYVLASGGAGAAPVRGSTPAITPRGGATIPNARTPAAAPSTALGAGAVMSAVQSLCTRVTDTSVPAQYRSSLYDCAGKAAALQAR